MDVRCPRDQHSRKMDQATGRLSCQQRECQCPECRWLSPQEQKGWRGHQ
jgi:hypothetical protein